MAGLRCHKDIQNLWAVYRLQKSHFEGEKGCIHVHRGICVFFYCVNCATITEGNGQVTAAIYSMTSYLSCRIFGGFYAFYWGHSAGDTVPLMSLWLEFKLSPKPRQPAWLGQKRGCCTNQSSSASLSCRSEVQPCQISARMHLRTASGRLARLVSDVSADYYSAYMGLFRPRKKRKNQRILEMDQGMWLNLSMRYAWHQ